MRLAACLLICAGTAAQAQDRAFDPASPFEVQQVTEAGALVSSRGFQYICDLQATGETIVLTACLPIVSGPMFGLEPLDQFVVSPIRDLTPAQATRVIQGMPAPAFEAMMLSVFNDMDCVIDFSDVEVSQHRILSAVGAEMGFSDEVFAAVRDDLDERVGVAVDAMAPRFLIDYDLSQATLIDGCEQ